MSKNASILLVDDDKDDQQIITDIIRELNIPNEVIIFNNGNEAYEYLVTSSDQPFLILCDINMPVMGGIELRKNITDNKALRRKSIPFIFLTTTASPKAVKEAYEMSVQGFFEKRTQYNDFKKVIQLVYEYWQECNHPNN